MPKLTREPESRPTHEQIEQRAYQLYVRRGDAAGSDTEDWLQAERELLEEQGKIGVAKTTAA
jgi:Protein of unknown function (DUF2934)